MIDLFGASGGRIEAEIAPGELFAGAIDPGGTGLLGAKSGFTPSILDTLGGGLSAIAVRVTINGGGTGPGDPARGRDVLLVNGSALGDFSSVPTQQTSPDGRTGLSMNPDGGFRSGVLDTGFFSSTDAGLLARIYASIEATGSVGVQFQSTTPSPRALDFLGGLAPEIQNVAGLPILAVNPPIITDVRVGSPINEGSTATIDVTAFNLHTIKEGGLTYEFDPRGDGSFSISNTNGSATLLFDQPGTYVVPIRVYNPDGARAVAQAVIEVLNVAPSLQSPGDQHAVEGTIASLDLGSLTDPGRDAPWTVVVDWGDGSAPTTFDAFHVGALGTADHVYARPGAYTVGVHVTDVGGLSGDSSFTTIVANVAPTVKSPGDQTAVEGTETTFAMGSFGDPGADGPWTVHVSWSDGLNSQSWTVDQAGDLGRLSRIFGVHGVYAATIDVTDALGPRGSSTFQVNVADVAPAFDAVTFADALDVGRSGLLTATFHDPGFLDRFHVSIDWGDRTTTDFGGGLTARSYQASHAFSAAGTYQAAVTVVDLAGASATVRLAVTVNAASIPITTEASGPAAPRGGAPVPPTAATQAPPRGAAPVLPTLSNPSAGALNFFNSASPPSASSSPPPPKGSIPVFPAFPGQGLGGSRPFSKMARKTSDGDGGRSLEEILADLLSARKAPIQVAAASTGTGVAFAGDLNGLVPTPGPKSSAIAGGGSAESQASLQAVAGNKKTRGKATRVMILMVAWTVSLRNQRKSSHPRRANRHGHEIDGSDGRPS